MKVIFLDIDGVLNSEKWMVERFQTEGKHRNNYPLCEFDPQAINLLNKILVETDSKIVISSTWRLGRTIEELSTLFETLDIQGEIIDITPCFLNERKYGKTIRGDEIKHWLENNEVESYVIIDDDNDMRPEQRLNFIKTSWKFGLQDYNTEDAIKILNK